MSGLQDIYDRLTISLPGVHGVIMVSAKFSSYGDTTYGGPPHHVVTLTFHGVNGQQVSQDIFFRTDREAAENFARSVNTKVTTNA